MILICIPHSHSDQRQMPVRLPSNFQIWIRLQVSHFFGISGWDPTATGNTNIGETYAPEKD